MNTFWCIDLRVIFNKDWQILFELWREKKINREIEATTWAYSEQKKRWKVIIGTNQIHIINKLVLIELHNEIMMLMQSTELFRVGLPSVKKKLVFVDFENFEWVVFDAVFVRWSAELIYNLIEVFNMLNTEFLRSRVRISVRYDFLIGCLLHVFFNSE